MQPCSGGERAEEGGWNLQEAFQYCSHMNAVGCIVQGGIEEKASVSKFLPLQCCQSMRPASERPKEVFCLTAATVMRPQGLF